MKQLMFAVMMLVGSYTFATSDAHDRAYILVQHIQEETFFIERGPIIGCYGLVYGPRLYQLTSEYKVSSNIGCGGDKFEDNINYLVCAKVLDSKESDDFMGYSEMTLDISKCEAKNDPQFLKMVKKVVKMNFPLKKGEIKLSLVK